VLASDNFAQGYVGFPIGQEDFTTASKFEFKVLDQQGSNTVYITLVDAVGAIWSTWSSDATKSVLNAWATIEFDYTAAASVIDLTQVAEIRFAEWNSGSYRFSDVALLLTSGEIETGNSSADQDPEHTQYAGEYTIGSNATGSIVADAELNKDVIELEVLASNNFEQGYVGFPYQQEDFSNGSTLEFKVLDQQGSNSVYITLVDAAGATWSTWSSDATKSVLNAWTTIEFDYSAAANVIDLTQVTEVRFAEWNSGTYRFSDLALLQSM
ncbi:MAG: hypothetical protein NZ730_05670, partial [Porticoccaceae bacterium]|nr:hypothetical protein [Porticoccaceae bacterium]